MNWKEELVEKMEEYAVTEWSELLPVIGESGPTLDMFSSKGADIKEDASEFYIELPENIDFGEVETFLKERLGNLYTKPVYVD